MNNTITNPKSSERFYRPELDALRFVAFLGVFADHGIPTHGWGTGYTAELFRLVKNGGQCGVCIFFLLSAYLITELLRRESEATGDINLKAFYIRRILRIWPLYFGVIYGTAFLGLYFQKLHMDLSRVLAFSFLIGNWYVGVHKSAAPTMLSALWSISVEEQFYLIWPVVKKFAKRRSLHPLSIAFVLGGWVVSFLYAWTGFNGQIWSSSLVQFQFFAAGTLVAIHLNGRTMSWSPLARSGYLLSGVFGLVVGGTLLNNHLTSRWGNAIFTSGGFVIILFGSVGLLLAFLGSNPKWFSVIIVYLGKISFGLYVFHQFGFMFSHFILSKQFIGWIDPPEKTRLSYILVYWMISFAFTAAVAHISYCFYELPFLRLKKRFEVIRSRIT